MIRQGRYTKKITPTQHAQRSTRRGWRWWQRLSRPKKIMIIAGPILAFLILTPLITYAYYYNDISDQERLMNRNNTGVVLTDRNGEKIYSVGRAEHRKQVPLADISEDMKHALIASEDKDFYKHEGFSIAGITRATWGVLTSGGVGGGGGSTLTQQLAKNTLLTSNQTFLRKYQELFVAIAIEQQYNKDQILEMYLNSVLYGENAFGIEDAARIYFGKTPAQLDLAESAMLVGVLPAPNTYSPISGNAQYAAERQNTVLTRMVTNGYITEAQKTAAKAEVLHYAPQTVVSAGEAPHFSEMVMQELYKKYDDESGEKVMRSGYQVTTTLDLSLQRQLQSSVAANMRTIQRGGGSNAGAVAIDPSTGEIRGLVGSADWNNPEWGKVNMATAKRQPGSSFKPIYYAGALADGVITPATILHDKKTDFGGYTPKNANNNYYGDISVRSAISRSLNIPSIEVMQKYSINKSIAAAKKLGITTIDDNKNYGLPLALGSAEIPLLEMTNAYAAFANQGQQYPVASIQKINDKFSKTIFTASHKSKTAISAQGAFLISSILSDNNARAPIFGSSLTVPGRTAAVKTGTTDDQRDAWTIGYTPQLAVGVWVGNNNNAAMSNGGSGMAGPIWVNTLKQALKGVKDTPFVQPSGVVQKPVCYSNGGLASAPAANTYNEYFLASALPSTTCNAEQKKEEPAKEPEKEPETDTPATTTPTTPSGNTGTTDDDTPTSSGGTTTTPGNGSGTSGGTGSGNSSSGGSTGGTGSGSGSGSGSTPPSSGSVSP